MAGGLLFSAHPGVEPAARRSGGPAPEVAAGPLSEPPGREPAAAVREARAAAPQPRVAVHVNARPWATIRIDGRALGATPLSEELAPGAHELEASFPDGRTLRRRIHVSADSRHFSLP